jgi:hypothetical protein
MTYRVESGIPVPSREPKYPLLDMTVGDSFLVECGRSERATVQKRLVSRALYFGRRHKVRYTCRIVEKGVRCWRVK